MYLGSGIAIGTVRFLFAMLHVLLNFFFFSPLYIGRLGVYLDPSNLVDYSDFRLPSR
ncbi:hypothetical protein BDZ91DRAFT_61422 [Kalaharituber pfeilii]|nr:hypothetical protein BDZ91DRAFT_61422 [Kalaharituber pfeilii]